MAGVCHVLVKYINRGFMLKAITKQDIVVENNGGIAILPKGTILEAWTPEDTARAANFAKERQQRFELLRKNRYTNLSPEQNAAHGKFDDYFTNNLVITKKEFKSGTDTVEGRQTDVDDFDEHVVETATGEIFAKVTIPKELVPVQFVKDDVLNDDSALVQFVESLDIDDLDYALAEKAGLSKKLWSEYDKDSSESDLQYYISVETTDEAIVMGVIWEFSLLGKTSDGGEDSTLSHRGGYSRGGNYPDA